MNIKSILVPFDFGDPALYALAYAKELADRFGASLHLLHVVPNPYEPGVYLPLSPDVPAPYFVPAEVFADMMRQAEHQLELVLPRAERQAFRARVFVKTGDPWKEIVAHAAREHVDLIVMGTHGRTGAGHFFLGSVAERVAREAPCPVATVRARASYAAAREAVLGRASLPASRSAAQVISR